MAKESKEMSSLAVHVLIVVTAQTNAFTFIVRRLLPVLLMHVPGAATTKMTVLIFHVGWRLLPDNLTAKVCANQDAPGR